MLLILALWVLVLFLDVPARYDRAYSRMTGRSIKAEAAPAALPDVVDLRDACEESLPAHGSQKTYAAGREDMLHSRLYVANEHVFPMLLVLFDPESSTRERAVMLHPLQSAQVQLPVGSYGLKVQSGLEWCNLATGFFDGEEVAAPQLVEIKGWEVVNLRLIPYGDSASDVMFSFGKSLGAPGGDIGQRPEGIGTLNLQRVVGGHYAVMGSINQKPVHFLVDTGATFVSVPAEFAAYAGITDCEQSRSNTANGVVDVCLGTARELTLGQFRMTNVKVSYHEGLGDTFLLGMNVIGQFRMEQQGDVMRISLH